MVLGLVAHTAGRNATCKKHRAFYYPYRKLYSIDSSRSLL